MQSLEQEVEPPVEGQHIVRAAGSRGSNIIEVRDDPGICRSAMRPATSRMHGTCCRRRCRLRLLPALFLFPNTQVEYPDGRSTLCLLPAKFHKKVWVRKGSYLIVEDVPEAGGEGSRVTGQIVTVLFPDHVKQLRKMPGVW